MCGICYLRGIMDCQKVQTKVVVLRLSAFRHWRREGQSGDTSTRVVCTRCFNPSGSAPWLVYPGPISALDHIYLLAPNLRCCSSPSSTLSQSTRFERRRGMYSSASRVRLIGIVEKQHSARSDAIKLARSQRSTRVADPTHLGNLQASKHSSNVSARQGASCCNFQGKPVVYGGWTNGWNTIRNDVNILKTSEVQSSEGEVKKVLEWETLSCGGCSPPCTYGPVIVAAESKECGECLVVHGGVQFGGYAGPVCDLRVLKLIGTDSAGERRWDPHESVVHTPPCLLLPMMVGSRILSALSCPHARLCFSTMLVCVKFLRRGLELDCMHALNSNCRFADTNGWSRNRPRLCLMDSWAHPAVTMQQLTSVLPSNPPPCAAHHRLVGPFLAWVLVRSQRVSADPAKASILCTSSCSCSSTTTTTTTTTISSSSSSTTTTTTTSSSSSSILACARGTGFIGQCGWSDHSGQSLHVWPAAADRTGHVAGTNRPCPTARQILHLACFLATTRPHTTVWGKGVAMQSTRSGYQSKVAGNLGHFCLS